MKPFSNARIEAALLALALGISAAPAVSFAQTNAAASALFQQGKAAFDQEDYKSAIVSFLASYKADPQLGTLFTLAVAEEKARLYASAHSHYEEFLAKYKGSPTAQQAKRAEVAEAKLKELAPLRAMLRVSLAPASPSDTRVHLDNNVELNGPTLGVQLPVDPGEHTLTVEAPGRPTSKQTIKLDERQSMEVEVVVPLPPEEPRKPTEEKTQGVVRPPPPPPLEPVATASNTKRTAAFIVGGVGLAGIGFGVLMGGLVAGTADEIKSGCPNGACTNENAFVAHGKAKTYGLLSEIGFGVGLAGLGVGTLLYVISPSSRKSTGLIVDAAPIGTNGMMTRVEGQW